NKKLLVTTRPSAICAWSKSSRRFRARFTVRLERPPFVASAVTSLPCASRVMGCWPLWLLSLLVSHCPSLGHLCRYQLSFMKLSSTFEPCRSKLSHTGRLKVDKRYGRVRRME